MIKLNHRVRAFPDRGRDRMKTLLAVDGNSILNRAFFGIRPLTNAAGLYTHAVWGFLNIIARAVEDVSPDAVAAAFDLRAPTFRHRAFDGYKAGRHAMPDELAVQLPWAKKVSEAMGWTVLSREGFEADDILGTLSALCEKEEEWRCFVLTGDRDSLQLISDRTTVLLAGNAETARFDRERFRSVYGVDPSQFVDVKALMGDSSDNIPGVAGIGEKTALKLISAYGSLENVFANREDPAVAKGVRAKLAAGEESAKLSQFLARIVRDVPLDLTPGALVTDGIRKDELLPIFRELEFTSLIKKYRLEEAEESPVCEVRTLAGAEELEKALEGAPRTAVLYENGVLRASVGAGELSAPVTTDELTGLLLKLRAAGVGLIVFDSKALWTALDGLPDDFAFSFDCTLAAYVLDPSEGKYTPDRLKIRYLNLSGGIAAGDLLALADVMEPLLEERGQMKLLTDVEQPLAGVLARMEREGFRVDTAGLADFSETLEADAKKLEEAVFCEAGMEFNINSPKQLGDVLFDRLMLPHGKKTKTGYSTNAEILEKLAPYYPIVQDILSWRQLTKLRSTYCEGLVRAADGNGRVHSSFNQTITATGRLSSTEPNLQNIPVRTELGRELRRFFLPSGEGRVLVDADYSQIELRLLAAISGDETMIEAFRNGVDIHTVTASQVFGLPVELVTSDLRKKAKAVNFGIVYGISDFSLSQDIGVSKREAADYISAYLARYPKVSAYLTDVVERAKTDGYVTTQLGRRRYIPELTSGKRTLEQFGERVAMNSPTQGAAADIIKIAMVNVEAALKKSGLDAKLILQVHDELIVDAAEKDAEAVRSLLAHEMENAVECAVPLTVSTAVGATWFDCKD